MAATAASLPFRLGPALVIAFALLAAGASSAAASEYVTHLSAVTAKSVGSWKVVTDRSALNVDLSPATFQLAGPVSLIYSTDAQGNPKLEWSGSKLAVIPGKLSGSGTYATGAGTEDLGRIDVSNVVIDLGGIKFQPEAGGEFGPVAPKRATVTATRTDQSGVLAGDLAKFATLSGKYTSSANGGVTLTAKATLKALLSDLVADYGIPAPAIPPNTYVEVVLDVEARGHIWWWGNAPAPAPSRSWSTASTGSFDEFDGE